MMWTPTSILGLVALIDIAKTVGSSGNSGTVGSCPCDLAPMKKFDLQALLKCGGNSMAYSIWDVPGSRPFCLLDAVDQDKDGNYMCYKYAEGGKCSRIPYTYLPRVGSANPNSLARDPGGCSPMSKSLIVDTDNCNYLVQAECYANGTVNTYLTYKESWPRASRDAYIKAAARNHQISYIANYTIDCENGRA